MGEKVLSARALRCAGLVRVLHLRRHRIALLHHHLVVRPLRDLGVGGVQVWLRRVWLLLLLLLLRLLLILIEGRVEWLGGDGGRPGSLGLLLHDEGLTRGLLCLGVLTLGLGWLERRLRGVRWRRALLWRVHGVISGRIPVYRCKNSHKAHG